MKINKDTENKIIDEILLYMDSGAIKCTQDDTGTEVWYFGRREDPFAEEELTKQQVVELVLNKLIRRGDVTDDE